VRRRICGRCEAAEAPPGCALCGVCLGPERRAHEKARTERRTASLVMRLPAPLMGRLDALVASTRIRKGELLREGLADLLAKHGDTP
jgi:hypothetical protein